MKNKEKKNQHREEMRGKQGSRKENSGGKVWDKQGTTGMTKEKKQKVGNH